MPKRLAPDRRMRGKVWSRITEPIGKKEAQAKAARYRHSIRRTTLHARVVRVGKKYCVYVLTARKMTTAEKVEQMNRRR